MFTSIYFSFISLIIFLYTFTNFNIGQIYLSPSLNTQSIFNKPKMTGQNFQGEISADSVLIIDAKTKVKLWGKEAETKRPSASLTKLMTALVFLKSAPHWQKVIEIKKADFQYGSSRYLKLGEQLTVKDLFHVGLIGSDNVAITALVRSTGLSEEEFIKRMNQQARLLGMNNSSFVEPTGLLSENVSTATDLSQLVDRAFQETLINQVTSLKNYQLFINPGERTREIINTNKLLGNNEFKIVAGKTGSSVEAGYCLASLLQGNNGQQIVIIVLGSKGDESRFSDTKTLAEWVFANFIFY